MVSLYDVGLLHLLLLMTIAAALNSNSATAAGQGRTRPAWIQYIDAMYAACISQEVAGINMKLTTLSRCFNAQREYLQCISSVYPSDKFLALSRTSSGLRTPCGLIHLSSGNEASFTRRRWIIGVHSQLYLNLTVLEFVLPMPYGKCNRSEGSEYLVIRHEIHSSNLARKDDVFLCGEHSPFSLVWTESRALLVYRRLPFITQIGHFHIQYQVCDQRVRTGKVHIIYQASVFQKAGFSELKLSKLPSFESYEPRRVMYTVYLLGNRLKVLMMRFVLVDTSKEHFSVDAFDGPGPAELHRHPINLQVLDSEWIQFSMFQAYLQITCEKYHCGGIFIKYGWTSALPHANHVKLSEGSTATLNDFTRLCSQGNHWYCVFSISASNRENVEISLQTVNFHGPDYLGGFSEPYNCLLAGVTIADGYRATFMKGDDFRINDLGDIPKDLAVDSVLPEITTCYKVPVTVGDSVVWGFPIDTFVSYSSTLLFVFYAYEAYVDLSKSDIKLVIRPSHSAGLIVSCPSIHADGYLGIETLELSASAGVLVGRLHCLTGNILFVELTNLQEERMDALSSQVIICTNPESRTTTVMIVPKLSAQSGPGSVRSLFVQTNPYTGDINMFCHFQVMDVSGKKNLEYTLFMKVPVSLHTVPFNVMAISLTSGYLNFGERKQLAGRYLELHIYMISPYASAKINASLPCTEAVKLELSGETHKIFERHLQQTADVVDCRNYSIPLWNDNKTNNDNNNINNSTHLIYLPKITLLENFGEVIETQVKMGKLSAFFLNRNIGNFHFIININLHGTCAQHCNHIMVQTVYRALVSHNIVSLQWNLVLNTGDFQVTLCDVPVSGVLLYITSLNDKCIHKVCSANIDVQSHDTQKNHVLSIWNDSASDQTPFAEYHLLWSHGAYTWDQAEEICQELAGMHLASISSEKEYLLITRMLLGSTYHVSDTDEFYLPTLTPCMMGSPLCVIYIGLKRQVSQYM